MALEGSLSQVVSLDTVVHSLDLSLFLGHERLNVLKRELRGVKVDGKELKWLVITRHSYIIDLSTVFSGPSCQLLFKVSRDQQRNTKCLGGSLKSGRHVDMRREV